MRWRRRLVARSADEKKSVRESAVAERFFSGSACDPFNLSLIYGGFFSNFLDSFLMKKPLLTETSQQDRFYCHTRQQDAPSVKIPCCPSSIFQYSIRESMLSANRHSVFQKSHQHAKQNLFHYMWGRDSGLGICPFGDARPCRISMERS
jgi:hypothetical protein